MRTLHLALPANFGAFETLAADNPLGRGYTFEGHASAWEKDLAGNLIQKGAFIPSIKNRLSNRMIKVRWLHDAPMGYVLDAKEDDVGLWVKCFVPQTGSNDERIELMRTGVVDKMSIGFDPDFESMEYSDGERKINKLTLYEVSPVDLPMNESTDVDTIVALMNSAREEERMGKNPNEQLAGATLSAANQELLRGALSSIQKVLDSAAKTSDSENQKEEKDKEEQNNRVEETLDGDWSESLARLRSLTA